MSEKQAEFKFEESEWRRQVNKMNFIAVKALGFPNLQEVPTQEMIHKWIRDVHGIYVHHASAHAAEGVFWTVEVYNLKKGFKSDGEYKIHTAFEKSNGEGPIFHTYEDAYDFGIGLAIVEIIHRRDEERSKETNNGL